MIKVLELFAGIGACYQKMVDDLNTTMGIVKTLFD